MKNKKAIVLVLLLLVIGLVAVALSGKNEKNRQETVSSETEKSDEETADLKIDVRDDVEILENEKEEGKEGSTEVSESAVSETIEGVSEETSNNTNDNTPDSTKEENDEQISGSSASQNKSPLILEGNIRICEIGKYIGSFVEDGSDEFVENVMMIVLENQGDQYIQLANVTVNNQYMFEVTTLFPGEKIMVLEKNRTPYVENMSVTTTSIDDVALFREVPDLCEGVLKIDIKDGMVLVSNVSGKDFSGGKLFFKNKLSDKYLGGITYFLSLPELAKGQEVKLSSAHFREDSSELLFVTYAE